MKRTVFFGQDVRDALDVERVAQCEPSTKIPGCFKSESLCRWQSNVHARGFRGVQIVPTIFGYSVRSDTGLDNFALLAGHRDGSLPNATKEEALTWAKEWHAQDPEHRYVTD